MTLEIWERFADAAILRAVRQRQAWIEVGPDVVGGQDDDPVGALDRLLHELPSVLHHEHVAWSIGEAGGDLAAERAALHRTAKGDAADDPFTRVARSLDLDPTAVEVLAITAAVGWSLARQRLVAYAQGDEATRGMTVSGLSMVLCGLWEPAHPAVMAALAPDSTLRQACLLEVHDENLPGTAVITVAPSVQWHLRGVQGDDPGLPADARSFAGAPVAPFGRLLLVHGPDRIKRLDAAGRLLDSSNVIATPEPTDDSEWEALVRTAVCHQAGIVLEVESLSATARRWIQQRWMVPWVVSSPHPLPLDDLPPILVSEVEAPERLAEDEHVKAVLGSTHSAHRLTTNQLDLLGRIDQIDADQALRRLASGALEGLATRIRPERTWHDLVLPDHQTSQLRELVVRVRHRAQVYEEWGFRPTAAKGLVALFSGPSGTGKTMATEILAGDLGLEIFRIDLSAMVSKYIGETEKNLARVFDAAEGASAVLLFDEADAVFGKRTAVTDAHDRYANVQTSYLLQRIEAHEGIVILTTNLPGNIDEAFTRRIHVVVDFPAPEAPERQIIWQRAFPEGAPLDELKFDKLAERFAITGGSIRSAALTAAFLAADEGTPIGETHVLSALRSEYSKLGRLASVNEFDPL